MSQTNNINLDDCWLFAGYINPDGYGQIGIKVNNKGFTFYAHRVMYELYNGSIGTGLVIDHLCRIRRCVNPEHMESVTNRENLMRGKGLAAVNAQKTYCYKGHEFNEKNTMWVTRHARAGQPIERKCRTCKNLYRVT